MKSAQEIIDCCENEVTKLEAQYRKLQGGTMQDRNARIEILCRQESLLRVIAFARSFDSGDEPQEISAPGFSVKAPE